VTVEKHQNDGLVATDHEDIGLGCDENWFDLKGAILEEPCDITVLVLLLVELLEFHSVVLEFRWKCACGWCLFGPMTIGKNLSIEVNTCLLHASECLCFLEQAHQIL
jgi:hypothetical protein